MLRNLGFVKTVSVRSPPESGTDYSYGLLYNFAQVKFRQSLIDEPTLNIKNN